MVFGEILGVGAVREPPEIRALLEAPLQHFCHSQPKFLFLRQSLKTRPYKWLMKDFTPWNIENYEMIYYIVLAEAHR
jgi:hypothetical protein